MNGTFVEKKSAKLELSRKQHLANQDPADKGIIEVMHPMREKKGDIVNTMISHSQKEGSNISPFHHPWHQGRPSQVLDPASEDQANRRKCL